MLRLLHFAAAFLVLPLPGSPLVPGTRAQHSEEDVRLVIDQLFDGMRAGDSTMVRSVFAGEAQTISTGFRNDGTPAMQVGDIDRFVQAVGTPHDVVWDEKIWDVEIRVDDNLATAWMKYAFFLGEQFSHCGVDAFVLVRRPEGWKVVHLSDTRRRGEACEMPPDH